MSSFAHFPRVQWQRNAPPGVHRRCLRAFLWPPKTLFSVRTFAAVCARAWDDLPAMSRHTMSKAPREKPAFFLTGGQSFFMVSVSQRKLFFLCPVLCGCVGVEGAFPLWWCFHPGPRRKSGFPGLCQPVAHACKPMPNPVIFRPKLSGFPRVAATTRGFSAGRT